MPLKVNEHSIEWLKWLGLLLMVLDHLNKYLFVHGIPCAFEAGRVCMPLFAFVLAYNLARPTTQHRTYLRVLLRTLLCGCLATPAFIGLGGLLFGWWPLNIMFMLAASVLILYLLEQRRFLLTLIAGLVFVVAGSSVEFWWPGILFTVLVWKYFKTGLWLYLILAPVSLMPLQLINGSQWALGVIPVVLLASKINRAIPRQQYFFYAFYPLHLAGIYVVKLNLEGIPL